MAEACLLKSMVMSYRVSELNALLTFAGKSKAGRKPELQVRALELLALNSSMINAKIKEIYKTIPHSSLSQALHLDDLDQTSSSSTASSGSSASQSSYSSNDFDFSRFSARVENTMNSKHGHPKLSQKSHSEDLRFPVLPDVKFKKLPFYDVLGELLRPSSLVPAVHNEANFSFHLTPQQAASISQSRGPQSNGKTDYTTQIQIRFCLMETSCEQDDYFPPNLVLKVNNRMVPLPNPIPTNKPSPFPKRPAGPLDITTFCRVSSTVANTINIMWSSDMQGRGHAVGVFLVNRLTFSDLLNRLKNKGSRPSEYTRGLIKEKLFHDSDLEIATTTLQVSLACPLGKTRMILPCRSTMCTHLQCFDASLFLQMNERKPKWTCPVCDSNITYDTLAIDGYFSEILNSRLLPVESMEVQLNVDGSWSVLSEKKSAASSLTDQAHSAKGLEVCTLVEDELEVCEPPPTKKQQPCVIDLVSSSSESEDEAAESVSGRKLSTIRDYFLTNPSKSDDYSARLPTYYPDKTLSRNYPEDLSKRSFPTARDGSSSPDIIELD